MANEVDKRAKLQNAMSKAKKLMQLESNGTLDKIAAAHKDGINATLTDPSGEMLTEGLMTTSRNRQTTAPMPARQQMGQNASNMPKAILEEFMSNPIDDSALYAALGEQGDGRSLSFLTEGMDAVQPTQTVVPPQNVRQIVNEGMGQQYVQQPQVMQSIDYPMIRTIVEEIVRKYAVSLNKKIMNESKQTATPSQVNTIALGETFKFLDNNGNVYECTMKKVSNINEIKKKRGIVK
jgi:hypothetical protein